MTPPEPLARLRCELDGDITVPFSEITVRHCVDNGDAEYRFFCPLCTRVRVHLLHPSMVRYMLSLPIVVEEYHRERELDDVRRRQPSPPLTEDDFRDFQRELESL